MAQYTIKVTGFESFGGITVTVDLIDEKGASIVTKEFEGSAIEELNPRVNSYIRELQEQYRGAKVDRTGLPKFASIGRALFKIANHLDTIGEFDFADEIDLIMREAAEQDKDFMKHLRPGNYVAEGEGFMRDVETGERAPVYIDDMKCNIPPVAASLSSRAGTIDVPAELSEKVYALINQAVAGTIFDVKTKLKSFEGELTPGQKFDIPRKDPFIERISLEYVAQSAQIKNSPEIMESIQKTLINKLGVELKVLINDTSTASFVAYNGLYIMLHLNFDLKWLAEAFISVYIKNGPQAAEGVITSWFREKSAATDHELVHVIQRTMDAAIQEAERATSRWTGSKNKRILPGRPPKATPETDHMYSGQASFFEENDITEVLKVIRDTVPEEFKEDVDNFIKDSVNPEVKITEEETRALKLPTDIIKLTPDQLASLSTFRAHKWAGETGIQGRTFIDSLAEMTFYGLLENQFRILHTLSDVEFFALLGESISSMTEGLNGPGLYTDEVSKIKESNPNAFDNYVSYSGMSGLTEETRNAVFQLRVNKIMKSPVLKILKERAPERHNRFVKELYIKFDQLIGKVSPKKPLEQRPVSMRDRSGDPKDMNPWLADDKPKESVANTAKSANKLAFSMRSK